MPISIACPACGKSYSLPDAQAGKNARCGKCRGVIKIPAATAPKIEVEPIELSAPPDEQASTESTKAQSKAVPTVLSPHDHYKQKKRETAEAIIEQGGRIVDLLEQFSNGLDGLAYYAKRQAERHPADAPDETCLACGRPGLLYGFHWYKQIGDRISSSGGVISPVRTITFQSVPIFKFTTHHRYCSRCVNLLRLRLLGLPIVIIAGMALAALGLMLVIFGSVNPTILVNPQRITHNYYGVLLIPLGIYIAIRTFRRRIPPAVKAIGRGVFQLTKIRRAKA